MSSEGKDETMTTVENEARLALDYLDRAADVALGDDPRQTLRFILAAKLTVERGLDRKEVDGE